MNWWRWGAVAIVFVCGCGGGAASGAGPETAGASEEPAAGGDEAASPDKKAESAEEPAADANESSKAGSDSAGAGETQATSLEGEDLEAVLKSVLSDPELLDHLHLDKPGRAPLRISGPNLPDKLKIVAGSYDVKVVSEPGTKKAPVLVFTLIERDGNQARVHYRFDVEGLRGSATVNLKNGHWMLAANRVIEK